MEPLFSERYGYVKPQDAIIREMMPESVENSLCTLFDKWRKDKNAVIPLCKIEVEVWCYHLNNRLDDIYKTYGGQKEVVIPFLQDYDIPWHQKLSLIEFILRTIRKQIQISNDETKQKKVNLLVYLHRYINSEFKRLHYGYTIINCTITPITSEQEIQAIIKALGKKEDPVQKHLNLALQHFADRENPDFCNSIKESITAVEVLCRDLTEADTLGRALDILVKKEIRIHPILKSGMHKLYDYTNQPEVGARHGMMDVTSDYIPSFDEAYYMLVSCSAFINYLRGIVAKKEYQYKGRTDDAE